jgi:hypothetical protein
VHLVGVWLVIQTIRTRRNIKYGLALLAFNFSESIAPCILLIVVNIRTGTPSNPSEALENVGIVVGPVLADADDAVVVVVVVVVEGQGDHGAAKLHGVIHRC